MIRAKYFSYPAGIEFDKNGNIIVTDNAAGQVKIFGDEGIFLGQFGRRSLNRPLGLSLDSNGNIILAAKKLIETFSSNGQFLSKIGGKSTFTFSFH